MVCPADRPFLVTFLFICADHAADGDFRSFGERQRLLGGGRRVISQGHLMLGQRMAGDVKARAFFFILQQIGAAEFLHIRQGSRSVCPERRRISPPSKHIQLPHALVVLRLLAHFHGAIEHRQQLRSFAPWWRQTRRI